MKIYIFLLIPLLFSCNKGTENILEPTVYYPPTNGVWATINPESLNWKTTNLNVLYNYLETKGTKGFIILKDGKIAVEKYFNRHTQTAKWNWYSVGKTLTSLTVGVAQEEGYLNISDKTSDYLGVNWTSLSLAKESLITIEHQLTMTTGLDETNSPSSTLPSSLTYFADAGTRWAYHNSPYTLLQDVVSNATNISFNVFFTEKIGAKIGLNGFWFNFGDLNIYRSTTRDFARFGLLTLNKGKWKEDIIINDTTYFNQMINTSQNINKSYGYLWWLNGKESFMKPSSRQVFNRSIIPNAPNDMIMALGANDQKIYIIPSENLVIIRCGQSAQEAQLTTSSFDNVLWGKINAVID